MKVLVIGNGGREHALAWKLAQSTRIEEVIVAPGNAGTALEPRVRNVAVSADDLDGLLKLARQEHVGLTVVGPEAPLAAGIVDRFVGSGLRCFGPRRAAARLESSKRFAKEFMARHGIPTARYATFTDLEEALAYVAEQGAPLVIKADGLAAGKGVVVAHTQEAAEQAVTGLLGNQSLGAAGERIVIEEFLAGEEASFIAMVGVDGSILPLASSQDHKARDDGDQGPNTGGMGAYSPAPVVTDAVARQVMEQVMQPTVDGLRQDGTRYFGFLYAGLMIGSDGIARVLEFNCRLGDPEAEPVLCRLQSDLVDLIDDALDGRLARAKVKWDPRPAVGVVLASGGYPEEYATGYHIEGLPAAPEPDVKIFHAGTALDAHGRIVTRGGRVLCVVALGDTVADAQRRAYGAAAPIHWRGIQYRRDIGHRAIAREQGG